LSRSQIGGVVSPKYSTAEIQRRLVITALNMSPLDSTAVW